MTSSSTHQQIWQLPKKLRRWLSSGIGNSGSSVPEWGQQAPSKDAKGQPQKEAPVPTSPPTAYPSSDADFRSRGLFLLSQRLDVLTERLELLQERLNEAIASAFSRKESTTRGASPSMNPTFAPDPKPRAGGCENRDPSLGSQLDPAL